MLQNSLAFQSLFLCPRFLTFNPAQLLARSARAPFLNFPFLLLPFFVFPLLIRKSSAIFRALMQLPKEPASYNRTLLNRKRHGCLYSLLSSWIVSHARRLQLRRVSLLPVREDDEDQQYIEWILFVSHCRAVP
jgi:hypothetical protein